MKRPAAASAGAPAKKPAGRVASVAAALKRSENFSEEVKAMLAACLSECLQVPKEKRHAYQVTVLNMVGEVLADVESGIKKEIEAAETRVAGAATTKVEREAAQVATQGEADTAAASLETKKTASSDAVVAVKAAKTALSEAEHEQKQGDADYAAAAGKKEALELGITLHYIPLKEGTATPADAKKSIAALKKLGETYDLGSVLVAVPSALTKAPDTRGDFDHLVLAEFDKLIETKLGELVATLAVGEPAVQELTAKVEAAKTALTTAEELDKACKEAVKEAKETKKNTATALTESIKSVERFLPELMEIGAGLDTTKASLESLQLGPLQDFRDLLEYTLILPPEPEAPAEEVPPAAEVPAPAEQVPAPADEAPAPAQEVPAADAPTA